MAEQDDLNTPLVALVGFLGALMVFVIVLFLAAIYRGFETRLQLDRDITEPYTEVTDLANRQRGSLASYGWVDPEEGVVSIPIGRAIDLAVHEIRTEGRAVVTRPEETQPDEGRREETHADETAPDKTSGAPPAKPEGPQTTDAPEEAGDAKPE